MHRRQIPAMTPSVQEAIQAQRPHPAAVAATVARDSETARRKHGWKQANLQVLPPNEGDMDKLEAVGSSQIHSLSPTLDHTQHSLRSPSPNLAPGSRPHSARRTQKSHLGYQSRMQKRQPTTAAAGAILNVDFTSLEALLRGEEPARQVETQSAQGNNSQNDSESLADNRSYAGDADTTEQPQLEDAAYEDNDTDREAGNIANDGPALAIDIARDLLTELKGKGPLDVWNVRERMQSGLEAIVHVFGGSADDIGKGNAGRRLLVRGLREHKQRQTHATGRANAENLLKTASKTREKAVALEESVRAVWRASKALSMQLDTPLPQPLPARGTAVGRTWDGTLRDIEASLLKVGQSLRSAGVDGIDGGLPWAKDDDLLAVRHKLDAALAAKRRAQARAHALEKENVRLLDANIKLQAAEAETRTKLSEHSVVGKAESGGSVDPEYVAKLEKCVTLLSKRCGLQVEI